MGVLRSRKAKANRYKSTFKLSALSLLIATLSGCGGGSDETEASATNQIKTDEYIQGKVIDGYIQGATVFWDCNKNDALDSGELFTTTSKGGKYTLKAQPAANCRLLALQHFDSIDEDSPHTTVGLEYLMEAAPSQYALITPYTTLVAGHMRSTGLSVEKAEAAVASKLKMGDKILIDYQSSTLPNAGWLKTAAPVIVGEFQKTQGGQDLIETIGQVEDKLGAYFSQAGVLELIKLNVTPFMSTYQTISERLAQMVVGNTNNRLYRTTTFADDGANAVLDSIVDQVNAQVGATKFGAINWNLFSDEELKAFVIQLNKIETLQSNNPLQAEIAKLQAKRAQSLSENSEKYGIKDATVGGYFNYLTADPEAFNSFVGDIAGNFGQVAVSSFVAYTPVKRGRPPFYNKKIEALGDILSKINGSASCLSDLRDAQSASESEMAVSSMKMLSSCGAVLLSQYGEGLESLKSKKTTKITEAFITALGDATEIKNISEQEKWLQFIKLLAGLNDLFIGIADGVTEGNKPAQKIVASVNMAQQVLKAYASGIELDIKAGEAHDKNMGALLEARQKAAAKIMRDYFVAYLDVVADSYFEVSDVTPAPVITKITPQVAIVGVAQEFTLTGTNLPIDGRFFDIVANGCADISWGQKTSTRHMFTCTPTGGDFNVVVSSPPPNVAPMVSFKVGVSTSATTFQVPIGAWMAWDGSKYLASQVKVTPDYITNTMSNWGGLRVQLPKMIDGDNFKVEFRAKNDPSLGGTPAYDLGFGVHNDFSSGQKNASGTEIATRYVSFTMTNGYFNDFFQVASDVGDTGRLNQSGLVNTRVWHNYVLQVKNHVISLYVDGVLTHQQNYSGNVGMLDTFGIGGRANLQIDAVNLKFSQP